MCAAVWILSLAACGATESTATSSASRGSSPTGSVEPPATGPAAADVATSAAPVTVSAPPTSVSPPTTQTSASTGATDTLRVLESFAEPGSVDDWTNVDDTVMGGVSASTTTWSEGQMVFTGELSLENNGGFTSVRGPLDAELGKLLADSGAIVIDAEGDGRTYVLQIRTSGDGQYVARFATVAGQPQRYRLALEAFEPVTRFLDPAPDGLPLDASQAVQLTIYLLDGQEGPFRLGVAAISAEPESR